MISRIPRRRPVLGQSFTTCLLFVVVLFGGVGAYYFKVFQWRHLEDPLYDLTIVKKTDPAEIAFFKVKTVPSVVDPALQLLGKLTELRKESKKGTVVPEEFAQNVKEIANRLLELMDAGKLRQIPTQYEKSYKDVLLGMGEIYQSLLSLEESVNAQDSATKAAAYNKSLKHSKDAKARLERARKVYL